MSAELWLRVPTRIDESQVNGTGIRLYILILQVTGRVTGQRLNYRDNSMRVYALQNAGTEFESPNRCVKVTLPKEDGIAFKFRGPHEVTQLAPVQVPSTNSRCKSISVGPGFYAQVI